MFKPEDIRKDFPILQQKVAGRSLVYFDNAATTQKPQSVIDSLTRYYSEQNANVHRASHHLSQAATTAYEEARAIVAKGLNARSKHEIVWTRGTTESINLVAYSFGERLQAGDEIIISCAEHHANILPWQLLAQRKGLQLKVIQLDSNLDIDLEHYAKLLNNRTKLVSIAHISNALGTINPIAKMIAMAHEKGAKVLIDGAQGLPHECIDVQALDCDFYAFSGHKVFAPTGIGALYGKANLLESMPPWQSGGEMIKSVSFEGSTFQAPPFRFEAGTPNISGVIALAEAFKYLDKQDRAALREHEQALLERALEGCASIPGIRIVGQAKQRSSLVSLLSDKVHLQDLGAMLDQRGIAVRLGHHCAQPLMQSLGIQGTLRASFCFYNTLDEVDFCLSSLREICIDSQHHSLPPTNASDAPSQAFSAFGKEINAQSLKSALLKHRDWNDRYRQIMRLATQLPESDEGLRTDKWLISGCESPVWLRPLSLSAECLSFSAGSESRILRALVYILLAALNQRSAKDLLSFDIEAYFEELGLLRHLSPSRNNGLHAILKQIRSYAQQALEA